MMRPSEIFAKLQSQARKMMNKEAAIKYYEKQSNGIRAIKDTDGYAEIRNYFYMLYDNATGNLSNTDPNNAGKVAKYGAEMSVARSFLTWLDNLENSKE